MDGERGTPDSATTREPRIPPVVLKTLVTIVVGTVAYVITNMINQSQDELWKLAMSVVIGGAALIVQYMVDFEQRLASVETGQRTHTQRILDDFTRVDEVGGLLKGLDESGMSAEDVTRLVRSATQVGLQGPPIVKAFTRAEIASLSSVLAALTGMTAVWERDNIEWLIRLTGCARKTIDATSSSVDRAFWNTDPAGHYMDAQRAVMREHDVRIRLLFIVEAGEQPDDLDALCEQQRARGIEVRVLLLSASLARAIGATRDVVIFDDELFLEFVPDVRQRYVKTSLDADAGRVGEQVRRFDDLWAAAAEPAGPRTPAGGAGP
ncbi:hypothetical protein [Streptomyces sp. NPDC003374]